MYLDVNAIRNDFPILSQEVYGKPLVYLDNAATTQKPLQVLRKIEEVYSTINANIHRGTHHLSLLATESHEEARKTVQDFIHAEKASEIIFTRGATESINLVASSFCRLQCKAGDEIILTTMEHHANIVPWQIQRDITGVEIKVVPLTETGEIRLEDIEELISSKTKLISLTHVSNVSGIINPIDEVIRLAHNYNIPVLIDASQSVPHISLNVKELDCDFLVFSSHKMYGPTGIGVLYGKETWLEKMPPYQGGGEMIAHVTFEKTTFNELPFKFEAGTPDYVGSTALGEAIRYIESIGLDNIHQYEKMLLDYALEKLTQINGMQIIGNARCRSSVLSFLVSNIHPYDMGMLLDRLGIAVRTGHHCAQPLMDALGIEGTLRASFAFYNTREEIDILIEGIQRVAKMF
ncbi:MAG: Cysteine desulfurase SufS [Candidatus Ordinivivax streblomastigis]|uniref:Cysteine desulfurase n=1 Tax=Candidatus Ordinivivax streblomastigis TaxID=2540710 RepID=A0A5M8P5D6_9BACT|nr:MAG: Cysteine desulfurase SufS [Candidatus Ordinivivax streblomastigis]